MKAFIASAILLFAFSANATNEGAPVTTGYECMALATFEVGDANYPDKPSWSRIFATVEEAKANAMSKCELDLIPVDGTCKIKNCWIQTAE